MAKRGNGKRAREAAEAAERKRLLAGLARWERKQKAKRSEAAKRGAETRRANKAVAEVAARKRSDAAKRAGATRAANRAAKAAEGLPIDSRGLPWAPEGSIASLYDWERRGEWLQPGVRQVIHHVGSEYRSRNGTVKTELIVKVQQRPKTVLTAKFLREAALYWIDTGQQPAGMEFTAIHWARGARGSGRTLNALVNGVDAMEDARQNMLVRFFHLGK